MFFLKTRVLHSSAEEYHPRWGARTSNPVKSVNDRLGGFDSCLFRQTPPEQARKFQLITKVNFSDVLMIRNWFACAQEIGDQSVNQITSENFENLNTKELLANRNNEQQIMFQSMLLIGLQMGN